MISQAAAATEGGGRNAALRFGAFALVRIFLSIF